MTFALLLLLAALPGQPRVEKTLTVQPGRQEIVYSMPVAEKPLRLEARFEADGDVSLVILEQQEFRRRRQGDAHTPVAYSDFERTGAISGWLPSKGGYLVVADNRLNSQRAVTVKVQLRWETAGAARYPDPTRARTLAFASLALFLALGAFSIYRFRLVPGDSRQ